MVVSVMNFVLTSFFFATQTIFITCLRREPVKEFKIVFSVKYVLLKHCLLEKHKNSLNN